jgi:hypothetical protein
VSVEARFTGTSCAVLFSGDGVGYDAYVDDTLRATFTLSTGAHEYPVVAGLDSAAHSLLVVKRNTGDGPLPCFEGLVLDSGARLEPLPPRPAYRIEIIGGSLAMGFGNEAGSIGCPDPRDSTNAYYAYGPVLARLIGAEYHLTTVAGKGLVRNWASPFLCSASGYLAFFARTVRGRAAPPWDMRQWVPHVVIVDLGNNDYSSSPHAPREVFLARFGALLAAVRTHYGCPIVVLAKESPPLSSHLRLLVARERAAGRADIHLVGHPRLKRSELGCDWHPNVAGHGRIARSLAAPLRRLSAFARDERETEKRRP